MPQEVEAREEVGMATVVRALGMAVAVAPEGNARAALEAAEEAWEEVATVEEAMDEEAREVVVRAVVPSHPPPPPPPM